MPPGGEQSQQKRRTTANMGRRDPDTTGDPRLSEKISSPLHTDGYPYDEGVETPRPRTSVVRYYGSPRITQAQRLTGSQPTSSLTTRRQARPTKNLPPPTRNVTQPAEPSTQTKRNVHWLFLVGLGMLVALALWITGSWVLAWGLQRYNDIRYGYPRTFHMDAVVGHGGDSPAHPSHFIATNFNRQAIIIEFMAGDPAKSVSYVAPIYIAGDGGNLAPVTLEFRDVTNDNKPDMVVHIHLPSQDQVYVFVNDGTKFRPSNGGDKIRLTS
ncbi:hypothetical protein EPA93_33445 [Ktedonosporobacter rubrisoli]|uniref:VCBS repeat-containing protein n=1 Tax=Ktedonosporobacter rubrisoli TaxID=2509675 RepID=A0A4P6JXW2_KTERU|nr:hypothetical protein [Ktedonosporobacter rubrisoli]QBD80617.1 hypothetical protein EPA93_33445 [Ktedonosporobacter rubrisoli]